MSELPLDAEAAFRRYEDIRPRLPQARFPDAPRYAETLEEVAHLWDGFVLDAYGVLNVGDAPIPGAVARMARLRKLGKRLCVLTNGASMPKARALEKYLRLGFDFAPEEVVSSRDIMAAALPGILPEGHWGAICLQGDDFADLAARVSDVTRQEDWSGFDGFLLLSSQNWSEGLRDKLNAELAQKQRPLVVANPDLVAPQGAGLSIEPGFFAHDLLDRLALPAHWFGKPFAQGFRVAAARCGLPPERLAMVGDTLHTDILGAKAVGMGAVLVHDHGLFKGQDIAEYIARSGICPDAVVKTT